MGPAIIYARPGLHIESDTKINIISQENKDYIFFNSMDKRQCTLENTTNLYGLYGFYTVISYLCTQTLFDLIYNVMQ